MKIKIFSSIIVSSFVIGYSAFGQGALTPPGAPAATMKSLAQIEPRTPISSAPFTITAPGSYYLTTNVTTAVSNAIVISASGVTLDLSGFTLSSTATSAANGGAAILLAGSLSDVTIFNGHIRSGVTNNGSGVYSGSGFAFGIYYSGNAPTNVLVARISVSGCQYYGIYLNVGNSTVVEACTVQTVGTYAIVGATVKSCSALDCEGDAISGDQVSDCSGQSWGGAGVYAINTAQNCSGYSGGGSTGIYAATAQNCYGSSSSGYGLYAYTAQNCSAYSSSGTGLLAYYTAQDCYGHSGGSFYGIYGYGTVQNCYGQSSAGTGLYAANASFCTGYRSGGTAIQATIATGCYAVAGTNIITYKYNMP
jgi:hypothetical protein